MALKDLVRGTNKDRDWPRWDSPGVDTGREGNCYGAYGRTIFSADANREIYVVEGFHQFYADSSEIPEPVQWAKENCIDCERNRVATFISLAVLACVAGCGPRVVHIEIGDAERRAEFADKLRAERIKFELSDDDRIIRAGETVKRCSELYDDWQAGKRN